VAWRPGVDIDDAHTLATAANDVLVYIKSEPDAIGPAILRVSPALVDTAGQNQKEGEPDQGETEADGPRQSVVAHFDLQYNQALRMQLRIQARTTRVQKTT